MLKLSLSVILFQKGCTPDREKDITIHSRVWFSGLTHQTRNQIYTYDWQHYWPGEDTDSGNVITAPVVWMQTIEDGDRAVWARHCRQTFTAFKYITIQQRAWAGKFSRYAAMVHEAGRSVQLLPVLISTLGGWHPDAHRALCSVATAIAARGMSAFSFANFVPATRGITRDEQCSLPHVRSSVWHLRRNLVFHLST